MNEAKQILVVGCGTMGSGIAQVAAASGCRVKLYDAMPETAHKAVARIAAGLQKLVEKGHLEAAVRESTLARLQPIDSLDDAAEVEVAFEAVREDLEIKRALFAELEAHLSPRALLLSNTSMISITNIADGLQHPERVAGCHFFNPVPRMALVEIIPGEKTAKSTLEAATQLVQSWGKTPVAAPNTPGFIVNRALCMMLNEAAFLVQEGTSVRDVDEAMKLGCNFPMGPLELMDLIGVDVTYDCIAAMWRQFDCAPKYEPCALLREMVQQGKLGRKSGAGFYDYA